jgi:hypothetical protein
VNTYFYMVNIVLVVKLFYFYDILLKWTEVRRQAGRE